MGSSEITSSEAQVEISIPKNLHIPSGLNCCIYRVPTTLRETNPAAYTPHLVSIGPFHNGAPGLSDMEKQKLFYFQKFCERTGKTQAQLAARIGVKQVKIYNSYERYSLEPPDMAKFMRTILLDSVFIIELFIRSSEGKQKHEDDILLNRALLTQIIDRDLILLENQIPYFVLDDLYKFAVDPNTNSFDKLTSQRFLDFISAPKVEKSSSKCACNWDITILLCCFCNLFHWLCSLFFKKKADTNDKSPTEENNKYNKLAEHFTDFVRRFRSLNHPLVDPKRSWHMSHMYSAKRLQESGVRFKVNETAWPLGVKFKGGELMMAGIVFDDDTECLIRNLMALEQCHYPDEAYICSYIAFLDYLINTQEDVDLLIEKGIIVNLLGHTETVATMVNKLCLQTTLTNSCYYGVSEKLNKHRDNCFFQTMATMKSVYFPDLWRGTGTVAALILLVFTFIQAYYSMRKILTGRQL